MYREDDAKSTRPVQILAVAQMGGVPEAVRSLLSGMVRRHVGPDHSLWLDWNDRLTTLFGDHDPASTVIVADRAGQVRLVVSGSAEGPAFQTVDQVLQKLE